MSFDIISSVPIELSTNIFSYLNGSDLLNCCLVNKRWHSIANHEIVWRNYCARYFLKPLSRKENDENINWKTVYKENFRLASNWRKSNKIEFEFTEKRKIIHGVSTDGSVLVLGFGRSERFQPSELHIFDVKKGALICRQVINAVDEKVAYLLTFSNSSFFVAVQYSTHISIYQCKRRYFNFVYNIFWQDGIFHFATSKKTPKLIHIFELGGGFTFHTFLEICGDILYVYLPSLESLLIWNLTNNEKMDLIRVSTDYCQIVKHGSEVLAPLKDSIIVFERGKEKKLLKGKGPLLKILCNHRVIVGTFVDNDEVWVWERDSGDLLYKTRIAIPEEAILHPFSETIIYSLFNWQSPQGLGMQIKAIHLGDLSDVWTTSTSCLNLDATDHIVCDSLLILHSRFVNFTEGISVVDVSTGNRIVSHQFPYNTEIVTVCDKFIIFGQNESEDYNFPTFKFNLHLYYF